MAAARSAATLTVLIGVGSDRQIDRKALETVARHGGMRFELVDDMAKLGEFLAALGTQLSAGVRVDELRVGGVRYVEARPVARLTVLPYDYVLLIDRSGSMSESG